MFDVKQLTAKVTEATNAFIEALTGFVAEARNNTTANRAALVTAIGNYKQAVADENTVVDLIVETGNTIAKAGYVEQDETARQDDIVDVADDILDAIDDYTTGADLEVDDDSLEADEEEVEAE